MLQFVNILTEIEAIYDNNEPQSVKISGFNYFTDTGIMSNIEAILENFSDSDSDVGKAAAFLIGKNFIIMKSLLYQRFVRFVSKDKQREFIILYVEDTENADANILKKNLQNRALVNFTVLK